MLSYLHGMAFVFASSLSGLCLTFSGSPVVSGSSVYFMHAPFPHACSFYLLVGSVCCLFCGEWLAFFSGFTCPVWGVCIPNAFLQDCGGVRLVVFVACYY